jgi:hypothetical protein
MIGIGRDGIANQRGAIRAGNENFMAPFARPLRNFSGAAFLPRPADAAAPDRRKSLY